MHAGMIKLFRSVLFAAGTLLAAAGCSGTAGEPLTLNVVHINDVHAHLDEEPLDLTLGGATTRVSAGGFARIVTGTEAARRSAPNLLLLHAGDALQGTLYYTLFDGAADAAMMDLVPWDAFVLGNHEFDDGDANLAHFLRRLKTPVLAANVAVTGNDPLAGLWQPYVVKYFGSESVGIIGIDIAGATETGSRPGKAVHFGNEAAAVQRYVDLLEARGINKIVLLSHFGYGNDLNLSQHVSGVDVIIGGHSHTLMGPFKRYGLSPAAPYPVRSVSPRGEPVCIAQAWAYAKVVGRLEVTFDADGVVTACGGTPVLMLDNNFTRQGTDGAYAEVNASERAKILGQIEADPALAVVEPDPEAQRVLARYKAQVDAKERAVIGEAAELRHVRIPGRGYLGNSGAALPLGSEVAPVVAKAFYERVPESDLCILNAGGVRTNLDAGPVSIAEVYTMLPFSNTLFTIVMKGSEIRQVLEDAVQSSLQSGSSGAFPYAFGIRYDVDTGAPAGRRVAGVEIRDRRSGRWSPLKPSATYTVVTINYLAEGKNGYTTFQTVQAARGKGSDTYLDYAMSFVDYVKALQAQGKTVEKLPADEACIRRFR